MAGGTRPPSLDTGGSRDHRRDVANPGSVIGRPVRRRDAPSKVTGAARYTDDLVVAGAWFGLTIRSAEPHARIVGIDRDPAFDWSQVVVVTAADIPGENVVHLMADDQPVLVAEVIRHFAEPVALVAAADPATTRSASAKPASRSPFAIS